MFSVASALYNVRRRRRRRRRRIGAADLVVVYLITGDSLKVTFAKTHTAPVC